MSLSNDFYEEQRKKKKPSQVAADQSSGSNSAAQSFLDTVKTNGYKTAPVESKSKAPAPTSQPQASNPIGNAIDTVKKAAQGAIDSIGKAFQGNKIIAPIPEKDIVKPKPQDKGLIQKVYDTNMQYGGPSSPIAIAMNTVNLIDAAYKGLDTGIVTAQDAIYNAAKNEGTDKATQTNKIVIAIAKPLATVQKDILEPVFFNKATAPIMKGFTEQYLGGSKQVMTTLDTKVQPSKNPLVQGYNTVGELAGATIAFLAGGEVIKGLQFGKATLPVLFATIGQTSASPDTTVNQRLEKIPVDVMAGWLLSKVPAAKKLLSPEALKMAGISSTILGGQSLVDSLIQGLPPKEAATTAAKMAIIAGIFHIGGTVTGLFTNKLLTSKYGGGQIELTPEQAKVQMNATDLSKPEAVQARSVLEKATAQAEKEGKNLLIDINVAEKSKVAKLFNAKTPQGRAFTIELVEPKQIKLLDEQGAPSQTAGSSATLKPETPVNAPGTPPENLPPVIKQEVTKTPPVDQVPTQPTIRVPKEFKNPVEQKAFESITKDEPTFISKYRADYQNEVNPDLALKLLPGYEGHNVDSFSRAAGAAKSVIYNDMLQTEQGTKNNTVLITAGGSGSGKTTAVSSIRPLREKYSIVVDTTFSNNSAVDDIKKALDKGFKAKISYVLRDPLAAWQEGALPRVKTEGRIVSEDYFLNSHVEAKKNLLKAYEKYKDNSNVSFDIYVRSGGETKMGSIDDVRNFTYNREAVGKQIIAATEKAYEQKQISKKEYEAIIKDNAAGRSGHKVQPRQGGSSPQEKPGQKVTSQSDSGYDPSHPWYYKEGGKPIPYDQLVKEAQPRSDSPKELIKSLSYLKIRDLAGAKKYYTEQLAKSKARYEDLVKNGLKAINEPTYGDPQMTLYTALSLVHNHILYDAGALKTLNGGEKPTPTPKKEPEVIVKVFDKKGRDITTKKPSFNTKGARAFQEIFAEKITQVATTAVSQEDLVSKIEPFIDDAIAKAGTDKEILKGLRTAVNKEMYGYVGHSGNYKADYAELRLLIDQSPDIGDYLGMLEGKIFAIDEKLTTGDSNYSSSKASIGDYANLPNRSTEPGTTSSIEFPELVKIAKELMGKYPMVGYPRARPVMFGARPSGLFSTRDDGTILLNPDVFTDPNQAAKTLAHELGHLIDYLPDQTMKRGNLLGRIASLRKYMKTLLAESPNAQGGLITPKERAKIHRQAVKAGKENYEMVTREVEVGKEPTNPDEILSIWRDATVGIKNKELLAYIQGLSDAQKKEIAVSAMRGKVPEWVDFVHSVKETITEKVLKNSPTDIKALYKKMLKEEILRRRLFDLETIKKELQVLSNKWRPSNLNLAPEQYLSYRKDPAELYADAVSVLFIDPVMLKQEAPTFWKAFFNYLDVKPDVKEALFSTWDLLNKGEEAVFNSRQEDVEKMFDNSEQQFTAKSLEKAKEKTNLIYTLKLLFDSKNTPLKKRVNTMRKEKRPLDSTLNPVFAYEGLSYSDGKLENFVQENYQPIFEKTQKISDEGWAKLGSVLLYERSMNERGEMANPLGYSPKTAQDQLSGLEKSMKPEDWSALQDSLQMFRDATKKIVKMAEDAKFYSPELLKQMKANDSYATYQVIDYLDTYISAHVYKSIGTLKEIANPATSTVMKGISVVKAIERNNAKKVAVSFFKANFPDEITPAKSVFKGRRMEFIESKDPDLKMVRLIEDGKMTAYYMEKDLADNINNTSNDTIIKTAKVMRLLTGAGVYRPLFTSLNLGFSTFNFVRDFQRYWTNVPDYTLGQVITSLPRAFYRYGQAIGPSSARARNKLNPTITAMKELNIIGASYNGVFEHQEVNPEDLQIERIMKQYGLLDKSKGRKIFTPIFKVLDGIEAFNTFIETLPKVAGYKELKGSGRMSDLEMADFLRTKVGSPNFRSKGQLTPVTNSILLFSNAIKEGIKSDVQVAAGKAGKQSAGGFWWKTIVSTLLPTMFMFAAGAGLLGKWLEDRMKDVSEYDKTNFTIIPTGQDKDGKTTYIRIPRAETQRFMGGMLYKIMRTANRKDLKLEDVFDVFDYGAGQLPNITPLWTGGGALLSYLSGHNPYDAFRNRNVIPDTEFKAGFEYSFPKFVEWFSKNQGAGIVLPGFTDKNSTNLQKNLAMPFISNVIGRWMKVSDYGQTEANNRIGQNIDREAAKKTLDTRAKLDAAIKEYKSGPQNLTRKKQLEKQLVKDVVGKPKTTAEKTAKTKLIQKFNVGLIRGSSDPLTDSIIDANTNAEKIQLIYSSRDKLGTGYKDYIKELKRKKVISDAVVTGLKKKK